MPAHTNPCFTRSPQKLSQPDACSCGDVQVENVMHHFSQLASVLQRKARLLSDHLEALVGGVFKGRRQQRPRCLNGAVLTPDNLTVTATSA